MTVRCICGYVARDFDDAVTHVIESAGLPGGPHEAWNPGPPHETVGGEQITAAISDERAAAPTSKEETR